MVQHNGSQFKISAQNRKCWRYWIDAMRAEGYLVGSPCSASLNGVLYELGMGAGDTLTLSGGSWCTSGCEVDYLTQSPCVVDVLVDDGVGGAFKASFHCEGMYVPGFAGGSDAGGSEIGITGSIDGKHLPPPLPR